MALYFRFGFSIKKRKRSLPEVIVLPDRLFYIPGTVKAPWKSDEIPSSEVHALAVFSLNRNLSFKDITHLYLLVVPIEARGLFLPYRPCFYTHLFDFFFRQFFDLYVRHVKPSFFPLAFINKNLKKRYGIS